MRAPEGRVPSFRIHKALDIAVLILLGLAALLVFLSITRFQYHLEYGSIMNRVARALVLLVAFLLAFAIVFQGFRAHRENTIRQEEPLSLPSDGSTVQLRFLWKNGQKPWTPSCMDYLERSFRQYISFHRLHTPLLYYYYLAKKGGASLYAQPCLRVGVLILALACYANLTGFFSLTRPETTVLTVGVLVCFWLPGILMILLLPFQKVWVSWVEEGGAVRIDVTILAPFRGAALQRTTRAVESAFGGLQRLPPHHATQ